MDIIIESGVVLEDVERLDIIAGTDRFKNEVVKYIDFLEKESGARAGEGIADAAFSNIKVNITNAKKRVEYKAAKSSYTVTIPKKMINILKKKYPDIAAAAFKANGYTKGGKMAGEFKDYYYKKIPGCICTGGYRPAIDTIQVYFICVEDNADNLKFIKANHESADIFSEVSFI